MNNSAKLAFLLRKTRNECDRAPLPDDLLSSLKAGGYEVVETFERDKSYQSPFEDNGPISSIPLSAEQALGLFAKHAQLGGRHAFVSCPYLLNENILDWSDALFIDTRDFEFLNRSPRVSLVTSLFRTDNFLSGFLKNCSRLNRYEKDCDHYFIFSDLSEYEREFLINHCKNKRNIVLLWNQEDPGLYNCWNQAIKLANTDYISNANVDDLRDSLHLRELISVLDQNSQVSVAASAIVPFYSYTEHLDSIDTQDPWFIHQAGEFGWWDLATLIRDRDTYTLKPNNLPHSSPVWRKDLHDRYGYFDEATFGTFADWAFWLKTLQAGEMGYLSPNAYAYYYINPASHNRRGSNLDELHKAVESRFKQKFIDHEKTNSAQSAPRSNAYSLTKPKRKLRLFGVDQDFGQHRNSFNRLVRALEPLDSAKAETRFIPFIERYFVWGDEAGEAASTNPEPILEPWIGILHCPFDAPAWFDPSVSPETIFSSKLWRDSLENCRGIICLSEDLARDTRRAYPNLKILSLKHPTELNVRQFDLQRYFSRPQITQVGDWLRKLQSIHRIRGHGHKKIFLTKSSTQNFLEKEIQVFGDLRRSDVDCRHLVPNEDYDELLSESVVLCLMYGTAANNALIECIARSTPIIVNPLPSAVQYLGDGYPLYAETPREVDELLSNSQRIAHAHQYLADLDKLDLSYESFYRAVAESDLYDSLG